MPKMTKAQSAKLAKIEARFTDCQNAIYAFAPNGDARFSDCKALATERAKMAYDQAFVDLELLKEKMIRDCRAYRDNTGSFRAY